MRAKASARSYTLLCDPLSPFWQRLAASVFSNSVSIPQPAAIRADLEQISRVRAQTPRPQFPFSDYVGLMDALAEALGAPLPPELAQEGKPVIPQHYGEPETAAAAEEALAKDLQVGARRNCVSERARASVSFVSVRVRMFSKFMHACA